jgi:hypothetical protein
MCNNNNAGTATYDLSTADIITLRLPRSFITRFISNNGINEITNIYQFVSAEGKIYAKVTSPFGCSDIAEITLKFYGQVLQQTLT